jgi:hypothetical protein
MKPWVVVSLMRPSWAAGAGAAPPLCNIDITFLA